MVSIIIRTKNEERWIGSCLQSIFNQNYKDFEVILIDNLSTDNTIERAKEFSINIYNIEEYLPGKALNFGIEKSKGDIIVCLSGHCIPKNEDWLENLIKDLNKKDVAGVYGRQEPMSFSKDSDKRDLMLVFGLDKKIQKKDPFFHNANSAFKKSTWKKFPFDNQVTNIEDRVWGEEIIAKGLQIIYEPKAAVYHYHGIHQDGNPERLRNVVRIIERLELRKGNDIIDKSIDEKDIIAIIPVSGELVSFGGQPLINYTISQAKKSKLINRIIVTTDNSDIIKYAKNENLETHLREPNLSADYVTLETVFQDIAISLKDSDYCPDIIMGLEVTYPFRQKSFIDDIINKLIEDELDSVIPAYAEFRTTWSNTDDNKEFSNKGFIPRKYKKYPTHISLFGLGFVGYTKNISEGNMLGKKVGIYELTNPLNCIEIRDEKSLKNYENILFK